jgi:dsRNA-specific ribonuclease
VRPAFIGALFLEKGLEIVEAFMRVVFLPRLDDALATKQYIDPKSRLLQRHRPALPTYEYVALTWLRRAHPRSQCTMVARLRSRTLVSLSTSLCVRRGRSRAGC